MSMTARDLIREAADFYEDLGLGIVGRRKLLTHRNVWRRFGLPYVSPRPTRGA